jgi:hypothetical protein
MKKITLAVLLLSFLMSACGGASNEGEQQETKQKEKKEKLNKSTREGMEQLLEECHINIPEALAFEEVTKKSSNYNIKYSASDVDEAKREELDTWFAGQTEHLVEHGWKKRPMREDDEMFNSIINETIFFKPSGSSIDVTYGITISTTYTPEDKEYKVIVSAD